MSKVSTNIGLKERIWEATGLGLNPSFTTYQLWDPGEVT